MKPAKVDKKKKKKYTRPTVVARYKRVLKHLGENGGKMADALRKEKFSEKTVDNPQKVTTSKTWQELMDEYFPDEFVTKKHMELMNATKVIYASFPQKMKPKDAMDIVRAAGHQPHSTAVFQGQLHVFYFAADFHFRDQGLDKLYKISGKYKETLRLEGDKWRKKSNKEIAEIIAAGKKLFLKK